MRVFFYKTRIKVVFYFSTISRFLSSKLLYQHSLKSYIHPCLFHTSPFTLTLIQVASTTTVNLLFGIPLSTSPSFFHHIEWFLVNITLITHPSFKCPHYGYQMHLWPFGSIDWHNQYVILAKFGDATLELPDALKALSSNSYGDGDSSLC